MFKLLIDTSVWLDLTKEGHGQPLLSALEQLVQSGEVELIVPQTVVDEFRRNKKRVIEDAKRSMTATVKRARALVHQLGPARRKNSALRTLDEIEVRVPTLSETATSSVRRIEKLLAQFPAIASSDELALRAARRAIEGRAPFHSNRNSIADALILETYVEATASASPARTRFAFVTHNTKDFSDSIGDKRRPHPDLARHFTRVRSLYFVTLKDALARVAPTLVSHSIFMHEFADDPRGIGEIGAAIEEMIEKIWYDRHQMRASMIASGKTKIIPRSEWAPDKPSGGAIVDDIWAGALKAATETERRYGKENLGPWTDFEWGMLNGKLSALRWVLGDEWDMLDT